MYSSCLPFPYHTDARHKMMTKNAVMKDIRIFADDHFHSPPPNTRHLCRKAHVSLLPTLVRSAKFRKTHQWGNLNPWIQHVMNWVTTQWTTIHDHRIPPHTKERRLHDWNHGANLETQTIFRIKEEYASL